MAPRLRDEIIEHCNEIMQEKIGILTKWNRIVSILEKEHVLFKRVVKISELLVHPKNRSGLGVNAFNAHKVLREVVAAGADRDHLRKATAFELAGREEAVAFNKNLVAQSGGLLAAVTGAEQLLTISCSHFAAACRAMVAACKTPFAPLQDPSGHLNMLSLCKQDPILKDIIENGFEFTIIPAHVENDLVGIADLGQKALNAEQSAFSGVSELQAMSDMASMIDMTDGDVKTRDGIIEAVRASMPPCTEYLPVLCTFAWKYGGGKGAPMIGRPATVLDSPIYRYAMTSLHETI